MQSLAEQIRALRPEQGGTLPLIKKDYGMGWRAALSAAAALVEREGGEWVTWDAVDDGCYWWWWNGDEDCSAVPVFVMYSGNSTTYFASEGQFGWNDARDLSDLEGLWQKIIYPALPKR